MSLRRTLLAGAAATAAATGLTVLPASAATTATTAPWCSNADLHASYRSTDAGMGHRYGELILTNVSHHSCRTGGFGGLSYVGHGNGTQVGAAARRDGSSRGTYTVGRRQSIVAPVSETVAQNYPSSTCRPTHVDGFRVYVPDSRRSQYVAHPTTGCANTGVDLLSHQALRRG